MNDVMRTRPKLTPEQIAELDARMVAAGMIPYSQIINNIGTRNTLTTFTGNAHVNSLSTFEQWLNVRFEESLSLQAQLQLDNEEESDLFEWAVAHVALFQEVLINFKQAISKLH